MVKIILNGCFGRMGKVITEIVKENNECEIVAGVDAFSQGQSDFPIYKNIDDVKEKADVIIDFSNPSALDNLLNFATNNKSAIVLATTGYNDEQISKIKEYSKKIPVFFTFNMSLGINLLTALAKKAASILGNDFDIEIIEKHHNQKLDAPSGTALMLANSINEVFDDSLQYEYDRHSKRQKRSKKEIGMHSVRGGTIVGEHEVIFAGKDEVITLSHSAASRTVFANGAVKAAIFMSKKEPNLYDMKSIIF
ncbi:MAG: 4-hydroxy-tetrahydrodipicolinate reductase [Ruminococcaceae bacterium]|nr:4-hydroxy-tetrahydrodipicolinate reductase [Oscillospiraceae bacterium]